jgi:hypothetical protein
MLKTKADNCYVSDDEKELSNDKENGDITNLNIDLSSKKMDNGDITNLNIDLSSKKMENFNIEKSSLSQNSSVPETSSQVLQHDTEMLDLSGATTN